MTEPTRSDTTDQRGIRETEVAPAVASLYVVLRRPVPGQIAPRDRWLTPANGWTSDIFKAAQFADRGIAAARLGSREGDIVMHSV